MADGRFYTFPDDPNKYVSVTTFLSIIGKQQFLMPWAAKMERQLIALLANQGKNLEQIMSYLEPKQPYGFQLYTQEASDWGSIIHKAIDYKLKGLKLPKMTKAQKVCFDKWQAWWDLRKYELLGAERTVKSSQHVYAGTLDALVVNSNKERLVLDWKTGKSHYDEHVLQNFAYQYALHEAGETVDGGELVYVPKEGEIWTVPVPNVCDDAMKPVLAALDLWRWANRSKKKAKSGEN